MTADDDTPPMGIERPELREVIGVGGEITVLGPADMLIVRIPDSMDDDAARDLARSVNRLLPGRAVVFSDVDLAVMRDGVQQ